MSWERPFLQRLALPSPRLISGEAGTWRFVQPSGSASQLETERLTPLAFQQPPVQEKQNNSHQGPALAARGVATVNVAQATAGRRVMSALLIPIGFSTTASC